MEAVLELSRREALGPHSGKVTINGNGEPSYVLKQKLNGRLSELDQELKEIDRQIEEFKNLRAKIVVERQDVANQLNTRIGHQPTNLRASTSGSGSARNSAGAGAIDYMNHPFEWTGELKARMRSVFGIHEFRLCQEGLVPLSVFVGCPETIFLRFPESATRIWMVGILSASCLLVRVFNSVVPNLQAQMPRQFHKVVESPSRISSLHC